MAVNYTLKEPKGKKETLIFATYYFNGRRLKFSTGESIYPDNWNPVKQRVRKGALASDKINMKLDRIDTQVREVHAGMRADLLDVTPDSLRTNLRRHIETGGRKENLLEFYARYIEEKRHKGQNGYFLLMESTIKILQRFPGAKDFADIGPEWFNRYQAFMEGLKNERKYPKGYSPNYIGKNIGIIREVMKAAGKQGLHRNTKYMDDDYKIPKENSVSIYLSNEELMKIYRAKLSPALSRIRDRFLIGAFSGLRFSDSSRITLQSVRDGLIFDRNKKTKTDVVIPVHRVIKDVFEKYPDGLPPSTSIANGNIEIKKIGKAAGIDTPIIVTKIRGGVTHTNTVPKCELITTHTARRSAATNMFLSGIPTLSIMKITGHKTESAFMKYIKMSAEENAMNLKDHPYFSGG
jgi:site-specific recombinase XerD